MTTKGEKPITLSRTLRGCVNFARWCAEHRVEPTELAQLLAAVERHKSAWERSTHDASTSDRYCVQAERWARRADHIADGMGFTLDWPGLYPTLRRDGKDYYLPDV